MLSYGLDLKLLIPRRKFPGQSSTTLKKKDDLGFKSYETHPRAFALLLIWCLFTQSGLYWVSWTKEYLLKHGYCWDAKDGTSGSWAWRKLLKLLDYDCLCFKIEDGCSAYFWFDDWFGMGKLLDVTCEEGIMYMGLTALQQLLKRLPSPPGNFEAVDSLDFLRSVLRSQPFNR